MCLHKPVENALTSQPPIITDTSMKLGIEKKYAPNNNIETTITYKPTGRHYK